MASIVQVGCDPGDPNCRLTSDGEVEGSFRRGGALVFHENGQARIIIANGDRAPGLPETIQMSRIADYWLSQTGQVFFEGGISGPGIGKGNNIGLWGGSPDNIRLIAQEGSLAPGLDDGGVFGNAFSLPFQHIRVNGDVLAFCGNLIGDRTVAPAPRTGVWIASPSGVKLAVHNRMEWPTSLGSVRFACLNDTLFGVDRDGTLRVLFADQVDRRNAMFGTKLNDLQTIVAESDPAPAPDGTSNNNVSFGGFSSLRIHRDGQFVFAAGFLEEDETVNNFKGFGVWGGVGSQLYQLLREGETIELGFQDVRTVKQAPFKPIIASELNKRGQVLVNVAYAAEFGRLDETEGLVLLELPDNSASDPGQASGSGDEDTTDPPDNLDPVGNSSATNDEVVGAPVPNACGAMALIPLLSIGLMLAPPTRRHLLFRH